MAVDLDWKLFQLDIRNVLLNGELQKKKNLTRIPPMFEKGEKVRKVCRLKHSLYGLKQPHRAWSRGFNTTLALFKYKRG